MAVKLPDMTSTSVGQYSTQKPHPLQRSGCSVTAPRARLLVLMVAAPASGATRPCQSADSAKLPLTPRDKSR